MHFKKPFQLMRDTAHASSELVIGAVDTCAALPSGQAVADVLDGKPGAIPVAIGTMAGRAGLIGLGLAGARALAKAPMRGLVRDSIAGAVGVELFVVAWAAWRKHCLAQEAAKAAAAQK